ncbi:GyrI-like domain-containing protein [Methanobrevibacter filiformis]|uniref:GyrI-like small molecule binding domain-containing protein n=1 Tax=Methanobrevibacter filiformis TaxID=55758 RepID=A0A162FM08_9EURY|nr:GyrI-like domain-containing protein [Methanobrevibacter filiformis]KZX11990.1 hypothetical protein MBFIL_12700 [Methanobrevibacter filiformis]
MIEIKNNGNKMIKIDLKKEFKELYKLPPNKISYVEVPKLNYLAIDGKGDPNTSQEYKDSIEALMSVSFKTKFIMKKEHKKDYVVMPLEGLWYGDNLENFSMNDKSNWKWTSLIMQPNFVKLDHIKQGIEETSKKKDLPSLEKIEFREIEEGLSAQILYIGSYSEEGPVVDKIHQDIIKHKYEFNGKHHEIYLSDKRRTEEEKLKTIIRQPIKKSKE